MLQLLENVFLQALGKAIVASIWQTAFIYLLYQLVIHAFKIKQAVVRNFMSTVLVLLCFISFTGSLFYYLQYPSPAAIVIENGAGNNWIQTFTASNGWKVFLNSLIFKINLLLPYLAAAYLCILSALSFKLVWQLYSTHQLRRSGVSPVREELQQFVDVLCDDLKVAKLVTAYISHQLDIPATIGFLKPVILLPATTVTHLTPAQLEAVLLHELAHIKRNDYFWNLLLSMAEMVLFFNPFVLLLIHTARKERENCCDDMVMAHQQNAAIYAEALLNVEKARKLTPALAMALGDNKHHLMHRIKRILNMPAEKNRLSRKLLALLLFTILFAITGSFLNKQENKKTVAQKAEQLPLAAKQSVFYLSPDAIVKKEGRAILLKDTERKLKLEIRKEENNEEFVVMNDEGNEAVFDRIIFEDAPMVWHFNTEELPKEPIATGIPNELMRKHLSIDSFVQVYANKVKVVQEMERFYKKRMPVPATPHLLSNEKIRLFFKNEEAHDSLRFRFKQHDVEFITEQSVEALADFYRRRAREYEITQQQQQLLRQRLERLKQMQFRNKNKRPKDSAEPETIIEEVPFVWTSYNEVLPEKKQEHQKQFTIVIETNGDRWINGVRISKDSSQKQPVPVKRKVIEILQL